MNLGIGSGSHAEQTGRVMIAYEKVLLEKRPDLVVVVGDVNSTLAATLAGDAGQFGRICASGIAENGSVTIHTGILGR